MHGARLRTAFSVCFCLFLEESHYEALAILKLAIQTRLASSLQRFPRLCLLSAGTGLLLLWTLVPGPKATPG